jgi:hypothetical protein
MNYIVVLLFQITVVGQPPGHFNSEMPDLATCFEQAQMMAEDLAPRLPENATLQLGCGFKGLPSVTAQPKT